jgi:hypothetical protein
MTTQPEEIIIPLYVIQMKAEVAHFDGVVPWVQIGGPYEKEEADRKLAWVTEKHPNRTYKLTRVEE